MGKKIGPRIFYGWWIVVASTVAAGLSGGLYFFGFSTFFLPLIQDFSWSRAALSGAFSFSKLEGGIMGPVGGFLVDRLGPRTVMLAGVSLMGAGFILISRIDSLVTFYLVFIFFIAAGCTIGLQQAPMVAVANWFIQKRGLAMGIVTSGMGLGGLAVPFLAWLIVSSGWRTAAVVSGLAVWVVGIPLALAMRHRPEDQGLLADGRTLNEAEAGVLVSNPSLEAIPADPPALRWACAGWWSAPSPSTSSP
jgi:sugar phosphate permease